MRILHVIPGLTHERGGPSTVLKALAEHQAAAGHDVRVLTTDQGARTGETPVTLAEGVRLERLPVRGPNRLAYARGFATAVRAHLAHCDIVHAHSIFTYAIHVTLREALAAEVPLILRPCGLLHRYSLNRSALQKRLYLSLWGGLVRRACSTWHYTSEEEAAESWPHDRSPRFILPNGINPAAFRMGENEARSFVDRLLPDLGNTPFVLFLGRIHAKKRLDLLLEAFLTGAPASWKLVVAGPDEGNLWSHLQKRFLTDPAVARRVIRTGVVVGPEKIAILSLARAFALPSEHENFGVAALEALAAGTRALLSPQVDLAGPIARAGLGDAIPLEKAAWSNAIALLANPGTNEFAAPAREWVEQHYSWKPIVATLLEHYRALCK